MNTSSKVLLAIDTATHLIGLALYDGTQVINQSVWTSDNYHTVELAPAIEKALKKSSIDHGDLGAIAVASGPGSFTGLRIGIALAKGLALVQQKPIIGVPTLDTLALAQPIFDYPMLAVLRAGRGRLAVCRYQVENNQWQSSNQVKVFTPKQLLETITDKTYLCGELTKEERELFNTRNPNIILATPARSFRNPAFLAEIAWKQWMNGELDDAADISPTYLHYNDPIPG
jgi:tRNA threonylcarbamoyladenosine biosynthesis protein TsaB